jgi:creatinine amidohydrolase
VSPAGALRIRELTPEAVRQAVAVVPRLIVPVGTCEPHGPHLPLGADSLVVDRLADDLSAEFRILRTPTIEYGVNDPALEDVGGSAGVRRKTLRRWLNDLLPDWERLGIEEILILTMNGYAPHQEALGTVVAERAQVRVIDILAADFGPFVESPDDPIHGGEVDTSLVLYVRPDLVNMEAARDCIMPDAALRRYRRGAGITLPPGSEGAVGFATLASAEKGERLYRFILDRIRERLFTNSPRGAV